MFCSKNSRIQILLFYCRVIRKKKKELGKKNQSFFIERLVCSFCQLSYIILFYHTNFYSTFPELILQCTPLKWKTFLWSPSNLLILESHWKSYKDNFYLI